MRAGLAGAAALLWWATVKNRVLRQARRLRQPKYALGMAAGLAYLWFFFLKRVTLAPAVPGRVEASLAVELVLASVALLTVLSAWVLGEDRPALVFSDTEVAVLFSAPVSRRALLHYRLVQGTLKTVLSIALVTLVLRRAAPGGLGVLFVGGFVGMATANLHATAASLVRARAAARGVPSWVRWVLGAGVAVGLGLALRHALALHPFPGDDLPRLEAWGRALVSTQPLSALLRPFRALVAPALAPGWGAMARAAAPVALAYAALYLLVLRLDVPFEEAAVLRTEERARARAGQLRGPGGRMVRVRVGPPAFALAPTGRPGWALVWKNLTASRRFGGRLGPLAGLLVAGVGSAGLALLVGRGDLPARLAVAAAICAGFAGFMTLLGPQAVRVDLRMDLRKLELLRALPLSGPHVVAAEVAAPLVPIVLSQALLLGAGLGLSFLSPAFGLSAAVRVAAVLALLPVLPAVALQGLVVQNAGVVLLPAWMPPDGERVRGVEAFGQRLIGFAGTLLMMALGLLPAALVGGLLAWLGWRVAGPFGAVPGAWVAAAILVVEAGFAVWVLGRAFERVDVAVEGAGGEG